MTRRSRGVALAVALVKGAAGLFLVGLALLDLQHVVSLVNVLVLLIGAGLVVAGAQALPRGRSPRS